MSNESKMKSGSRWFVYLVVFLVLCGAVISTWVWLGQKHQATFSNPADAGTYGDSFGYVNSLFSGLALAGVVAALIIQAMEYSLASAERTEQLHIQKEISDQQAKSTAIEAISTQVSLNEGLELSLQRAMENAGYLQSVVERYRLKIELSSLIRGVTVSADDLGRISATNDCLHLNKTLRDVSRSHQSKKEEAKEKVLDALSISRWEGRHQSLELLDKEYPILVSEINSLRNLGDDSIPKQRIDRLFILSLNAIAALTGTYFDRPLGASTFALPEHRL